MLQTHGYVMRLIRSHFMPQPLTQGHFALRQQNKFGLQSSEIRIKLPFYGSDKIIMDESCDRRIEEKTASEANQAQKHDSCRSCGFNHRQTPETLPQSIP